MHLWGSMKSTSWLYVNWSDFFRRRQYTWFVAVMEFQGKTFGVHPILPNKQLGVSALTVKSEQLYSRDKDFPAKIEC